MGEDSAGGWRTDSVLLPHEMDFWATGGVSKHGLFCSLGLAEIGVYVNDDGVGGFWKETFFWIEFGLKTSF